jgi:signal transduction histidine kinase
MLVGYLFLSAIHLIVTWSDWWLDNQIAASMHAIDIALFGSMVLMIEGYTSPFFTFSVFILISATVRWGWYATAITSAVVTALFFTMGWLAVAIGTAELDPLRFSIRGSYLIVVSVLLIWFGMNQRDNHVRQLQALKVFDPECPSALPVMRAAQLTATITGASRIVFLWAAKEEPWVRLLIWGNNQVTEETHGPEAFDSIVNPLLSGCTFLFDTSKDRVLVRRTDGVQRINGISEPINRSLANKLGAKTGVALPIDSEVYGGLIFVVGVPGLSADDLTLCDRLSEEISAAFQSASVSSMSQDAMAARERLSLSRDLHDSVIQLMAGTAFRLYDIRKSLGPDHPVSLQLDTLRSELATEQRELRTVIKSLREAHAPPNSPLLCSKITSLLQRLSRQWDVQCELSRCPDSIRVEGELEHNILQLIREGVANAVRHGGATKVTISADTGEAGVSLIIADDGAGFPKSTIDERGLVSSTPWSLHERTRELGGHLIVYSKPYSTRVTITLPFSGC